MRILRSRMLLVVVDRALHAPRHGGRPSAGVPVRRRARAVWRLRPSLCLRARSNPHAERHRAIVRDVFPAQRCRRARRAAEQPCPRAAEPPRSRAACPNRPSGRATAAPGSVRVGSLHSQILSSRRWPGVPRVHSATQVALASRCACSRLVRADSTPGASACVVCLRRNETCASEDEHPVCEYRTWCERVFDWLSKKALL